MQGRPDGIQNGVGAVKDIVVPQAQDAEAAPRQLCITLYVTQAFGMLATIGFNDQPGRKADEVRNIRPDRHLTAKLEIGQPAVAEQVPKLCLSFSRLAPHAAGLFLQAGTGTFLAPLIRPSGTFSHEGRRGLRGRTGVAPFSTLKASRLTRSALLLQRCRRDITLLPLWEKVARSDG